MLLLLLYLLMLMLQVVELLLHLLETWRLEGGGVAVHGKSSSVGIGAPDRSPCGSLLAFLARLLRMRALGGTRLPFVCLCL